MSSYLESSSIWGGATSDGPVTDVEISGETSSDVTQTIIACVVSGIAVVLLVILLIFCYCRSRKKVGVETTGVRVEELKRGGSLPTHLTTTKHHEVANSDPLTVVVHHSTHCGYCKKFAPVIKEVGQELGLRVVFSEVSATEDNQKMYQTLKRNGVPMTSHLGNVVIEGYRDNAGAKEVLSKFV